MVVAAYRLEVDGRDVTKSFQSGRRLLSISVDDREGEAADSCSLEIDDRPPHVDWPPEGASLRVYLGADPGSLVDCGTFTLDAPESSGPPAVLSVRGHSANFITSGAGLPMNTERSRTWSQVTLGDMVATIAQEHGLTPRVQSAIGAESAGTVEQIGESDLAMLTRLATRLGGRVRAKAGALELVSAGLQTALPSHVIGLGDVESWSAPFGGRRRIGKVVARWYDAKTGAGGSKSAGADDPARVLTESFETAAEAASAAKSTLKDGERKSESIRLRLTHLDTSIVAGAAIELGEGWRAEVGRLWVVTSAHHYADGHRARTTIQAERSV